MLANHSFKALFLTQGVNNSFGHGVSVALGSDGGLGAAVESEESEDEDEGSERHEGDGVGDHPHLALRTRALNQPSRSFHRAQRRPLWRLEDTFSVNLPMRGPSMIAPTL